jgi:molecular chaperone GrpE
MFKIRLMKKPKINPSEELEKDDLLKDEEGLDTDTVKSGPQEENYEIDYKDRYVRLLSEFSNFQRQKDEELKSMAKFGNKNLLLKIIDVLDDVEMGLAQENVNEETKAVLTLLQSKLAHLLNIEGVQEIKLNPGDVYDPSLSEVLTMINDVQNRGKISHIARKGYLLADRVLRTAKVVVGK